MVKCSTDSNSALSPRLKIPLKTIIFWYKKISSYIKSRNIKLFENKECPTIYISKKYPNMSILELYQRISHHLSKYFPNIYQKLNSNSKKCLIKLKKNPEESNPKEKENKENENNIESSNNTKSNKNMYVLIKLRKRNKITEKIKQKNEKNCEKIKYHFESHKFENDISEKYNNCKIKEIVLKNNDNVKGNDSKDNDNDDNEESSSISLDDVSPCTNNSTPSSYSYTYTSNKINVLTHFNKAPRKSKYFNNDDYYSNKLKSIGNFKTNK